MNGDMTVYKPPAANRGLAHKGRPAFGPAELTENEIAWVEFLRLVTDGSDPGPTFRRVYLLRRILRYWR